MEEKYFIKSNAAADEKAIVEGPNFRITVLTSQLIRFEYNEKGLFEDGPTQKVLNRKFPVPNFRVIDTEDEIEVITDNLHLIYTREVPSKNSLQISVLGGVSSYHSVYNYGEKINTLGGTARTLDWIDGETELEDGIMSKLGFSCFDDSESLLITEDYWVKPREEGLIDFYFFGYGREYKKSLRDFYTLTGDTALLPRYALGNWWSRYYEYSEDSYIELINKFEEDRIPFSVAVIDMDWHLVDIDKKYGSGWTGYTWNKQLFPDPERFIKQLHTKGLKTSLNVHPADGVKGHEEMYIDMAKYLNKDYAKEEQIPFDITDKKFLKAYFQYLHHPNEEIGIDFWWIDWQSGDISKVKGLDPLWMLNHYHYLDIKKENKRPLIFSRYAGIGSHRYPIGFSGDSIISWKSLQFQPYFTLTASNVGYGWWSHDIGGHMLGVRDDELSLRWLQFGVFSPIMRLHSYKSPFAGKEPWSYNKETETIMGNYLRLRHELIPYIYSMNYINAFEKLPLIRPMYYEDPWNENAYDVKNQYYFGSEMIVSPITNKTNAITNSAKVTTWLPEGDWFDFFNGRLYKGNRKVNVYRSRDNIPVFVKAGGIVPLNNIVSNGSELPDQLRVKVYPGAANEFVLREDDGIAITTPEDFSRIVFSNRWSNDIQEFTIGKPEGTISHLPEKRDYIIEFNGLTKPLEVTTEINNESVVVESEFKNKTVSVTIKNVGLEDAVKIALKGVKIDNNSIIEEVEEFLNKIQFSIPKKEYIFNLISTKVNSIEIISELEAMDIPVEIRESLNEIIWAS